MNDGLLSDMGVIDPQGQRVGGVTIANGSMILGRPADWANSWIQLPLASPSNGSMNVGIAQITFGGTRNDPNPPYTVGIGAYNHTVYFFTQTFLSAVIKWDKMAFTSGLAFGWTSSTTAADGTHDLTLYRDAADTLAQRRSTTAQGFNLYNSYTSSTNFERLDLQWASNVCKIQTEKGSGGGTARPLVLGADATELMRFDLSSKISFFGATTVVKQTSGADLTNNVTSGGTTDTIADFTSLSVYATDAAAIRNDIYQLARKIKQINDGLRAYGLFT